MDFNHKMLFITSDTHFSHKNIINFERTQFKTIEDHDNFLIDTHLKWFKSIERAKANNDCVFIHLGDFGDLKYLKLYAECPCSTVFLYGNHDKHEDINIYKQYIDEVYEYPFFINDRILLSHQPQAVWPGILNVHGHLHGQVIDKPNYLCCSIDVANYKLITTKNFSSRFSRMEKLTYKFLYEPYIYDMKIIKRPQNDLPLLPNNNHIDVPRARMELNR